MEDNDKYARRLSEQERLAESSLKAADKADDALNISRGAIRVPSPNPSILSIDDSNNIRFGRNPDYVPAFESHDYTARVPDTPQTLGGRLQRFWIANKGLGLVLVAQLFGTLMNVTTRMLEMEGNDGEHHGFKYFQSHTHIHYRQRLSSLPNSICKNGHHCHMLVLLHVVQKNRTFPFRHEGSTTTPRSSRPHRLLWRLRHVL